MVRILNNASAFALAAAFCATAPAALAAGNAASGAELFKRCTVCHTATKDGPNRVGPNLFGVVGRKAGTLPGYSYSTGMKNYGVVWSDDSLAKFIASPATVVQGTKMPFGGFSQTQQADDVAAYLATLK
jgi:cytochrome c